MLTEVEHTATNVFHVTKLIFYKMKVIILPDPSICDRYQYVVHTAWECSVTSDLFDCGVVHFRGAAECMVTSPVHL